MWRGSNRGSKLPGYGALVALCGLAFASPTPAKAECAHYARPTGLAPHTAIQLELLARVESLSEPISTPASERRSPCAGGICRRGPVLPLSPAPPAPAPLDQWGLLAAALHTLRPESHIRMTEARPKLPQSLPSGIDHPPRFLSALMAG